MSNFSDKFSAYTMTQLNELLEDDDKLDKIVQEMEEMQEVQQTKEMTLASNRNLAEENLALQPRLEHKKDQLTKCYGCLQERFEAYQLRKSTLDHKSGNTSLDILLALLQAEGAKIEEETENMADSFLDGDVTLDTFIDSYQSKRNLAHLRRVKIEKLQEMVLKGQRLPQAAAPPHPSASSSSARPHHDASGSPAISRPLPLLPEGSGNSPVPHPRRKPPLPPTQPVPSPPLFAAASASSEPQPPPVFYAAAATPYPPIPPRAGQQFPNVVGGSTSGGYPNPFLSQYPPALPQRPPPRIAPQPGFIMQ